MSNKKININKMERYVAKSQRSSSRSRSPSPKAKRTKAEY
jgi:hypothetical protein